METTSGIWTLQELQVGTFVASWGNPPTGEANVLLALVARRHGERTARAGPVPGKAIPPSTRAGAPRGRTLPPRSDRMASPQLARVPSLRWRCFPLL